MKLTVIPESDVKQFPHRFNHSSQEFDFPAVIHPTGFSKWYHLLPFYDKIVKVNVNKYTARLLRDIMQSTVITGNILDSHRDMTHDLVNLLNEKIQELGQEEGQMCFVRLEYNSLKDSHKASIPFRSGEEIVKAILLSLRSMTYIEYQLDINEDMNVFLLPFRVIDRKDELRCFVHQGKVTAITQNTWFKDLNLHQRSSTDFERIVENILTLNEKVNADPTFTLESRVMDVEAHPDCSVTLIEFNPFAPCCGSGLFSWERDYNQLVHPRDMIIEFRIVGHVP